MSESNTCQDCKFLEEVACLPYFWEERCSHPTIGRMNYITNRRSIVKCTSVRGDKSFCDLFEQNSGILYRINSFISKR